MAAGNIYKQFYVDQVVKCPAPDLNCLKLDEPQYGMDVKADPFDAYNKIMNFAVTSLPDLKRRLVV